MKIEELLISIVYAYRTANNKQIAIWFDPDKGDFLVGVNGKEPYETAIVTAIMPNPDRWESKKKHYVLFASYVPTETCMGMAWRADVGKVVFLVGDVVHHYATTTPAKDGFKAIKGLPALTNEVNAPDPKGFAVNKDGTLANPKEVKAFHEAVLKSGDALLKKLVAALKSPFSTRAQFPHLRALMRDTTGKDILPKSKSTGESKVIADSLYSSLVYALVCRGWLEKPERSGKGIRAYGNNIGCILTDKDNKIVAWGLNYKGMNPNYHAETWMIQEYLYLTGAAKLPEGCTMYTSLESCYMCAGFFTEVAPKGRCVYLQEDPQVPNSALRRGVNGVTQLDATTELKISPDLYGDVPNLAKLKEIDGTDTVAFLFGKKASEKYKLEGEGHEKFLKYLLSKELDTEAFHYWVAKHSVLFLSQLVKMGDKSPVMKQIASFVK